VADRDGRDLDIIGKPLVKVDAAAKVVGQTLFADDVVLPRMLFARILRSPHPHARLRSLDVSRAAAHPGVVATLVGRELPIPFGILPVSQDEHALALDKVRFVGDPVAAVAALDEDTAEEALGLIDADYEVLPPVMSIEEALARPEPRIHDYGPHGNVHKEVSFDFGDVEKGFAEADHVREDTFFFEGNTHLPMEQHAALASFGPDGKLTLWSATQTPHYVHRALAKVLEMPSSHIRVIACPNGGGFGGKSDPFSHEIVVAKLSMKTGRPVKVTLTREEVFYCHRGRHPVKMWIRTGLKRDGRITAMHFRTALDGGAYGSYGVASLYYTGALQTVTYAVARYKFEGVRVFGGWDYLYWGRVVRPGDQVDRSVFQHAARMPDSGESFTWVCARSGGHRRAKRAAAACWNSGVVRAFASNSCAIKVLSRTKSRNPFAYTALLFDSSTFAGLPPSSEPQ
jgi:CO/xanthine dehydrogenase Mo-binding subunit